MLLSWSWILFLSYELLYSYPGCCVLKATPLVYQDRDTHVTASTFIADLHSRMPGICGEKTTFSTRAYNTVSTLSSASCSALEHPARCVNVTPLSSPGHCESGNRYTGNTSQRAALGLLSNKANDTSSSSVGDVIDVDSAGCRYAGSIDVSQQASHRAGFGSSSNKENDCRSAVLGSSLVEGAAASMLRPSHGHGVEWLSVQQGLEVGGDEARQTSTPIFGKPPPSNSDTPTKRDTLSGRGKLKLPPAKKSRPDSSTASVGRGKVTPNPPQDSASQITLDGYPPISSSVYVDLTTVTPTPNNVSASDIGTAALPMVLAVTTVQQHIMKKVCCAISAQ